MIHQTRPPSCISLSYCSDAHIPTVGSLVGYRFQNGCPRWLPSNPWLVPWITFDIEDYRPEDPIRAVFLYMRWPSCLTITISLMSNFLHSLCWAMFLALNQSPLKANCYTILGSTYTHPHVLYSFILSWQKKYLYIFNEHKTMLK